MRQHLFAPLRRGLPRLSLPAMRPITLSIRLSSPLLIGLVALLSLPALWPFYAEGLPRSFDGGLHLLRIALLHRHLMAGDLLPRWASDQILGYGYPLFNFYAPSTYYLVEGLHLLGLSFYAAFVGAFALLMVAAGVGMAWLARDIFGPTRPWAALVAAVAYVYAPYLLTNVYIRGALAEAGAQALLPWILWSARRLLRDEQPARYLLPFTFALGGLAITHNITLLFTPPLLLGYAALHWLQAGRSRRSLIWFAVALVGAMGLSAFFWLPLLVERVYLAETAYEIAKSVWLPSSVWRWDNFLDRGFFYQHTFARPIRLGAVQLLLALAGFVLARRWTAEWIFWGGVALICGVLMSAWSLPLWLSNDILPVAQFTWRLLSIGSLPLALFVGGLVWRLPQGWAWGGAVLLIALVIAAQRPQLAWMDVFAPETVELSAPVLAQVEVEQGVLGGGEGASPIQEFRPRWAAATLDLDPSTVEATEGRVEQIIPRAIGPRQVDLTITTSAAMPLRLAQFYYPGWRARLDGTTDLLTYPSTNLGLLTVDVPAGRHDLRLEWVGTPLQRWGGRVTLLALAALIGLGWRTHSRVLAALCALLLLYGLAAAFITPSTVPLASPAQPLAVDGVALAGFHTQPVSGDRYAIHPTWYISATPPDDLRVAWRLVSLSGETAGETVGETVSYPYFNTSPADLWAAGMLVDDAYLLPVAPGLAAGRYRIEARFERTTGTATGTTTSATTDSFTPVGELVLDAAIPAQAAPPHPAAVRFGDAVDLAGYATTPPTPAGTGRGPLLVLEAGEYLRYQLFWLARRPLVTNYHAFIHLVDLGGKPLVQEDHLPGPLFQPPRLWETTRLQPDIYLLRIPADAPSALYWPAVGMYDFATLERLPAHVVGADEAADAARLPPLKVVNRRLPKPEVAQSIQLGDFATLRGYDLALPEAGLQPGDSFTVTLYYAAKQPAGADYVRFLQLYAPDRGVIAQQDAPPRGGGNPTWSWQPGEGIVDEVTLRVDEQAAVGRYVLYMGLYDAADVAARVPLTDAEGEPLPDNWVPLVELIIEP